MWTLVGLLALLVLLHAADRRYKSLRAQATGAEVALAVGNRAQPWWREWLGVSGATMGGFFVGATVGFNGSYGALAAALLTMVYFERRHFPKLLVALGPGVTRVTLQGLRSSVIEVTDKTRLVLTGERLELQDPAGGKRVVLSRSDFPDMDFPNFWQWLTERQRDCTRPTREKIAEIAGFRAARGPSDLIAPREQQSPRRVLLIFWVLLVLLGIRQFLGGRPGDGGP